MPCQLKFTLAAVDVDVVVVVVAAVVGVADVVK